VVEPNVSNLQRHALEEGLVIYEQLGRTTQPRRLLEQFQKLLLGIKVMAQSESYQDRTQRLSSSRATVLAMGSIRRRLDEMWATIEGSQVGHKTHGWQWRDQRAKQMDVFVSEVEQMLLTPYELEIEEDRVMFLALLESERSNLMSSYTSSQLSVINKAYDHLVHQMQEDDTKSAVMPTLPEWFALSYEVEIDDRSEIGRGSFGGVYRGRWLGSDVIVKQIEFGDWDVSDNDSVVSWASSLSDTSAKSLDLPEKDSVDSNDRRKQAEEELRDMLTRQVQIWFGLNYPHVIRLFGACHIERLFFVCEFASNGSLDSYLRKHPDELWRKLYEGALGVQYLHARGIVHGDLKGNNIVVGADKKARVTDFGLSIDSRLLGKTGLQLTGAWQWVAPECLEHGSSRLSSASDVYSLGMCIIEALRVVDATISTENETEHAIVPLPWGSLQNAVVKYHVLHGRLPHRPSNCTDEQWTLVTRMCAFDPSDRLKISAVVDMLGQLANGEQVGNPKTVGSRTGARCFCDCCRGNELYRRHPRGGFRKPQYAEENLSALVEPARAPLASA
jgi:hypothetical protein